MMISPSTVGCVLKVDRESMRVLDQNGSVRSVLPSQISNKVDPRKDAIATDGDGQEIRYGDTVRERFGEQRRGTVLHMHRGFIFIHNRTQTENSGIFVARQGNVQTVASKTGRIGATDLTKLNPALQKNGANGTNGAMPPPKTIGRDRLLGKTVTIRKGPYKSMLGIVKDTTDTVARIELHSKAKVISVEKEALSVKEYVTKHCQLVGSWRANCSLALSQARLWIYLDLAVVDLVPVVTAPQCMVALHLHAFPQLGIRVLVVAHPWASAMVAVHRPGEQALQRERQPGEALLQTAACPPALALQHGGRRVPKHPTAAQLATVDPLPQAAVAHPPGLPRLAPPMEAHMATPTITPHPRSTPLPPAPAHQPTPVRHHTTPPKPALVLPLGLRLLPTPRPPPAPTMPLHQPTPAATTSPRPTPVRPPQLPQLQPPDLPRTHPHPADGTTQQPQLLQPAAARAAVAPGTSTTHRLPQLLVGEGVDQRQRRRRAVDMELRLRRRHLTVVRVAEGAAGMGSMRRRRRRGEGMDQGILIVMRNDWREIWSVVRVYVRRERGLNILGERVGGFGFAFFIEVRLHSGLCGGKGWRGCSNSSIKQTINLCRSSRLRNEVYTCPALQYLSKYCRLRV